jgi:hypothetical protein
MAYFKVYWVATVGESIVKAETEQGAIETARKSPDANIIAEDFWWHDATPCAEDAEPMTDDELKAYDIS